MEELYGTFKIILYRSLILYKNKLRFWKIKVTIIVRDRIKIPISWKHIFIKSVVLLILLDQNTSWKGYMWSYLFNHFSMRPTNTILSQIKKRLKSYMQVYPHLLEFQIKETGIKDLLINAKLSVSMSNAMKDY